MAAKRALRRAPPARAEMACAACAQRQVLPAGRRLAGPAPAGSCPGGEPE